MKRFSAFLERKDRENKNNLRTLGKVLARAGFGVKDHLDHHEDAFIYIEKPLSHDPILESLDFNGIRLYTRGKDIIAFRPQNKENAQPFGTAYLLDVKGMYKDLMKDNNSEKVGKDLIKYLVEEVLNFFMYSAKIVHDDEKDTGEDKLGKVIAGNTNGPADYANSVSGDLRRNNAN